MIPAIVLSGHVMAIGVIRLLGIMKVPIINIFYEKNAFSYVSRFVQKGINAPHPEKNENEFINLLKWCAERFGRCLIIPADDATLTTVSRNKDELEQFHIVACSEWHITEKFIDKKHTYELAQSIGIPTPRTCVPKSIVDLERIKELFLFPCLVKPVQSHRYFEQFKVKMVKVENFDQMTYEYEKAKKAGLEVMIQEFIPGDDSQGVNYNSYLSNEKFIDFTAQKVRLAPSQFGVPRVIISKHIPEIISPGRKILEALRFYGYSCTEFKYDARDGVYKLMEVNGRFNRSILQPFMCGINFPWIMYQDMVLKQQTSAQQDQNEVYWIDLINDIAYSISHFKRERYSLSQYFRPYFKKHIFSTFDLRDSKPFVKRCINLTKMIFMSISSIIIRFTY